jgi:hypothetical protein
MSKVCTGTLFAVCALWPTMGAASPIAIPSQSAWVDRGVVIQAGPLGQAWDAIFEGYTPGSIVQKDGVMYLYYVGGDNYISQLDNIGPSNRNLGVATSTDGINWTKHGDGPVISFTSTGNPEEGVPSGGVFLDTDGSFIAYYGANIAESATSPYVNADVRVSFSPDGLNFTGSQIVAGHTDPAVFGRGDELHAVIGYTNGDNYYAFYIPNGVPQTNRLGVSWGPSPDNLTHNSAVFNSELVPLVRGPGSIVDLGDDTLAFFMGYQGTTYVRTASASDPVTTMSAPVEVYSDLPGYAVVHLDQERQTWFMYHNLWHSMGLYTAPMGDPDLTGPLAPDSADAAAISYSKVQLDWDAATDPETGVLHYNVYRDGHMIGTSRVLSFIDKGAAELTHYDYEIRPVNLHDTEGDGVAVSLTTPADLTPPEIHRAAASGDHTVLTVVFNEPMDPATAGDASRYALNHGVNVLSASLEADGRTVTLVTTPQQDGVYYSLTTDGVRDAAAAANAGSPQWNHTYSDIGGLVGLWRLNDAVADLADDTSGYGHHGQIMGDPQPVASPRGGALHFNGSTDYVEIDYTDVLDATITGSFTVAAWVRPDDVPVWTTASDRAYAIFTAPWITMEYDDNQKFFARMTTTDGQVSILTDETYDPAQWRHIALVVDADNGEMSLYIDGVLVGGAPTDFTGQLTLLSEQEREIWMMNYYSQYRIGVADPLFDYESNYFKGAIDDVRIFNQALSAAEVMSIVPEPATALLLLITAGAVISRRLPRL